MMPTCMKCGGWRDDGRTKFVGRRCTCPIGVKFVQGQSGGWAEWIYEEEKGGERTQKRGK
jgi:hypothetical protein